VVAVKYDTEFDTIIHQLLSAASREEARRLLREFPWLTSKEVYHELTSRIAEKRRKRDPLGMIRLMAGRGLLHRCQVSKSLDKALADQPGWPLYNQGPLNQLLALPENAPADERIHWANLASQDVDSDEEPDFHGLVDFHLGWGFQDKAEEGSEEARDRAIAHFEQAEKAWHWEDSLFGGRLLGLAQEYLGRLYLERRHRDRVQDVEAALSWLQKAQSTFGEDTSPKQLALSMLLGKTYLNRVKGERLQNFEESIYYYHQAHALAEQLAEEKLLGDIEYSLAFAYRLRMQGDPADNYEKAREWAEWARDHFDRQQSPEEWARTMGELATIYAHRLQGDRAANLKTAIDYAHQALEIYGPDTHPRQWMLLQLTLGNMYCDQISGTRADNDQNAISCFQNVLEHCTSESEPLYWTEAMNNLGTVYASYATRFNDKNYRAAIDCFRKALEVRKPETMPVRTLQTATNWGNLEFWFGNWPQAHHAYATALRAAEILYRASYSPSGKEAELTDITALYERMVQVCLKEPDYSAALEAAEGGKARTFLDQMGQGAFPPPPDLPPDLLRREAELIENLRRQERTLVVRADDQLGADEGEEASDAREILTQRREVLNALEMIWNEMERKSQAARNYVAVRCGDPISWKDLCTLAERLGPGVALVEFYTLPDEIAVFVLRGGWKTPCVHRAPVNQRQLHRYVANFFCEVAEHPSYPEINQTWQRLAIPLLGEVLPHLKNVELLYLIPHGLLHHFPLHALEVDGAPLIEYFPVAYAPSAAVLERVLGQAEQRVTSGPGSALVVGNPTEDLDYAEEEAQAVAQYLRVMPYLGQAATKQLLLDEIETKRRVHLACHGDFYPLEPLRSGLVLHDGTLTAQEILKLRLSAELMVLSACQTARQKVSRGDELMGLLRVLLYAGASSLVVSLWSVYDPSTSELMRRFYNNNGTSRRLNYAERLQQAMLDIRRQPGWEHPYYWAPFILVGGVELSPTS
jgi:CHAT domain-containing protein